MSRDGDSFRLRTSGIRTLRRLKFGSVREKSIDRSGAGFVVPRRSPQRAMRVCHPVRRLHAHHTGCRITRVRLLRALGLLFAPRHVSVSKLGRGG